MDTSLTDPLGRRIVLYDHTWYGHIVPAHPELRRDRGSVEATVRQPRQIRYSSSSPDCRIYYGPGPTAATMMTVVVDIVAGVVKTAYRSKKMKGALEWSP